MENAKKQQTKKKMNNKGFTLMELIIVVAIIAILIALIAPALTGFLDNATSTSYASNAKNCYTAASAWAVQEKIKGATPTSFTATVDKTGVQFAPTYTQKCTGDLALENLIDRNAFGDAKAVIKFENGKCKSVDWHADGTGAVSYTYPES